MTSRMLGRRAMLGSLVGIACAVGCGGSSSGQSGQPPDVFSVEPASVTLYPTQTVTFAARLNDGYQGNVLWTVTGGTIDQQSGTYSSREAGTFTVRATLATNPSMTAEARVVVVGTLISVDILSDRTLTEAGSPYVFAAPPIAGGGLTLYNSTLTIEPGVAIYGTLFLLGSSHVRAVGTPQKHINVYSGGFGSNAVTNSVFSYVDFHQGTPMWGVPAGSTVTIDHCVIDLGTANELDSLSLGNGSISDSRIDINYEYGAIFGGSDRGASLLRNVITIHNPGTYTTTLFARSIVLSYSRIENNLFKTTGSSQGSQPGRLLFVTDAVAAGSIKGNTFQIWDGAIQSDNDPNAPKSTLDLSGNYWSTTDVAAIQRKFVDASTKPWMPVTFTYWPILAAPDPSTPVQ